MSTVCILENTAYLEVKLHGAQWVRNSFPLFRTPLCRGALYAPSLEGQARRSAGPRSVQERGATVAASGTGRRRAGRTRTALRHCGRDARPAPTRRSQPSRRRAGPERARGRAAKEDRKDRMSAHHHVAHHLTLSCKAREIVRRTGATSSRMPAARRFWGVCLMLWAAPQAPARPAARRSPPVAPPRAAAIADRAILPAIHFSNRIRRGQMARLPAEPAIDMGMHSSWAAARQSLKKNEAEIERDFPRFIRSASKCPFPVVGDAVEMHEEFWAFGESIKISGVDPPMTARTELGHVTTSFWDWGGHWMRTERTWRDAGGRVLASSTGGAQSWYHNTVVVKDCEGERLAYIKFKLGANAHADYTRITVHDLAGNEVAVAFTPIAGEDGSDWRHRRIVVHDRNSGMKMVELDMLDSGEDWRATFKEGSEVLGGLGSDPRVIVMLVASRDAASQFGIWCRAQFPAPMTAESMPYLVVPLTGRWG
jgi:hypothetical protein